jgi:hypothetical protein
MSTTTYQKPVMKNERNSKVVMHVARNSGSTLEAIHRLRFGGLSMDSARKAAKQLVGDGYLVQYPLWENKSLYRLGPKSIAAWGFPRKQCSCPGPQALPYLLGCLHYTSMGSVIRKRLLPHELKKHLAWFPESLMQTWAYLWEESRLHTIRVEQHCGNPKRVIQKISKQLYLQREVPEFDELYENDQLRVVVVVCSDEQEAVLEQANENLGCPVPLITSVYDQLYRFI